ncbi:MAG: hypothetical protein NTZ67_05645 [Gammaproteobacteria bacterium]|nr:hypothetical protein [Gammaproteobacteria bacterium]
MNRYPSAEISLKSTLKLSMRLHYLTLKKTIPCIALMMLVKYLAVFFIAVFPEVYMQLLCFFVGSLAIAYFFSVALLAAHHSFIDQPKPTLELFKEVNHRIFQILLTYFLYIAGIVFILVAAKLIVRALNQLYFHGSLSVSDGGGLIILFIVFMTYVALFYFAYPINVIDKKSIKISFYDSALLTEKNKVGVLMLFSILLIVLILLTPGTIHEYFLSMYHLDFIFDFIVLCVGVPFYINLLLLLINDSKQQ